MPLLRSGLRLLSACVRDVLFAIRRLRRQRGFAAAVVVTLALGIGVNASVFGLFNAVLLRPLPVDAPNGLVQIGRSVAPGRLGGLSFPLFRHLSDHLGVASGVVASASITETIMLESRQGAQQDEDFVDADIVSGGYFTTLGLRATAGRLLGIEDDAPTVSAPGAVISDAYWNSRFGRSPSALGQKFRLRGQTFTIVGVVPATFHGVRLGQHPDLFLPLTLMLTVDQREEPTNNFLDVMARLRPGASVEQADAEASSLWTSFVAATPSLAAGGASGAQNTNRAGVVLAPGGVNPIRKDLEQPLTVLMGLSLLVLLLACVNLSGLLLTRAMTRGKDTALRLALGARSIDLLRQFLAEGVVLLTGGVIAGIVIARPLTARLLTLFINGRDIEISVAPDWRLLAFTVATAVACGLIVVVVPALWATRVPLNRALRRVPASSHGHIGRALIVVQFGLSMVLVVGAALFVGTLAKLYSVDRGFDSDGVLIVNVRSTAPYSPEQGASVLSRLVSRLPEVPGVQSATAAQVVPVGGRSWTRVVRVDGDTAASEASVTFNAIAPGFFATLGTPVLAGREFASHDRRGAPAVAIVNETFAQQFFHTRDVLGRRVTSVGISYDIVGLAADSRYETLRDAVPPTMYVAAYQREPEQPTRYSYLVRARTDTGTALVADLTRVVRAVDPALRLRAVMNYGVLIDQSLQGERVLGTLGTVFGVLALVVAGVGLFALLAFQVDRRRNEMGLRLALGATSRDLISLVLREVLGLAGIGAALGAGASMAGTNAVRGIVFNVSPRDPSVIVAAAAFLAATAAVAAWLPAWRAAHTDPLVVLKSE